MLPLTSRAKHSDRPRPIALLFFVILLGIGSLLAAEGVTAIRTRHFEQAWRERHDVSIAPGLFSASQNQRVYRYDGVAAVRIGIGLIALGAMIILWGLCGIGTMIRPGWSALAPSLVMALCVASMLLQTIGLLGILSPWPPGIGVGLAMWATLLLTSAAAASARGANRFELARKGTWWRRAFKVLFFGTIITLFVGGRFALGPLLAIPAALTYAVPIAFLADCTRIPRRELEAIRAMINQQTPEKKGRP